MTTSPPLGHGTIPSMSNFFGVPKAFAPCGFDSDPHPLLRAFFCRKKGLITSRSDRSHSSMYPFRVNSFTCVAIVSLSSILDARSPGSCAGIDWPLLTCMPAFMISVVYGWRASSTHGGLRATAPRRGALCQLLSFLGPPACALASTRREWARRFLLDKPSSRC